MKVLQAGVAVWGMTQTTTGNELPGLKTDLKGDKVIADSVPCLNRPRLRNALDRGDNVNQLEFHIEP